MIPERLLLCCGHSSDQDSSGSVLTGLSPVEKDLSPGSDDPQQAGLGCGNPGSWWVGVSVPEEVVRKGFLEEEPWSYKLEDA